MPDQEQRDEMHADATRVSQAHLSEVGTEWGTWRPLHLPMFRNLLIADLVSDMGTFMQGVGAAWLMVSQGAGPLLVALTQTASAFPFFLLALPAGALGDIFDRRKLILTTEVWMFSVAVALAILTAVHLIAPWALLLLTLALSIGDALEAPTWRAVLPELVPQQGLMPAIALNGIEFNLARALGPALGGWGAIRAAVRYTRNAPDILTVLGRIGCVMFFASAFWALLPTVAHELRRSATLYGLLLAVFGAGAVLGAMALQRTRSLFSSDALLALGTTVFAASLWGVAGFKSVALLSVAILFGGIAWTAIISLMTTVMQNLAPDWVRARAMAVFMLVYMGTWTAGSTFWGYVAGRQGTHISLIAAAIGTAVCPILVLISRLPDTPVDLGAWDHWGKPMLVGEVDPSQGPVLVTVEYEVEQRKADEFLEALHKFARVRRRDGASRWGVYRDTEHPAYYIETFIVESWAEHLRQHERLTSADRELEENVRRFESKPIKVRHFIYARSKRGRQ